MWQKCYRGFESHPYRTMEEFILFLKVWFLESGIKIAVILVAAWIITRIGKVFISRIVTSLVKESDRAVGKTEGQQRRINTLIKVFYSTKKFVIWTIAFLTILPEFNINIAPLLAGAGLAGLAIGMGARSLIQDYFSGIFILLEDQYRIGEKVNVGGKEGKVLDFNLRRTVIKDSKGNIHYIPNGQTAVVSNLSRK